MSLQSSLGMSYIIEPVYPCWYRTWARCTPRLPQQQPHLQRQQPLSSFLLVLSPRYRDGMFLVCIRNTMPKHRIIPHPPFDSRFYPPLPTPPPPTTTTTTTTSL